MKKSESIQIIAQWQDRLNRIERIEWEYDVEVLSAMGSKPIKIITGSSSELLSSEIGSRLAGRVIEFSILPFDFIEYLRFFGISVTNTVDYYRQ